MKLQRFLFIFQFFNDHALKDVDGILSTEDVPCIVKEHVFVASDHGKQDHNSVHEVQMTGIINRYLTNEVSWIAKAYGCLHLLTQTHFVFANLFKSWWTIVHTAQ